MRLVKVGGRWIDSGRIEAVLPVGDCEPADLKDMPSDCQTVVLYWPKHGGQVVPQFDSRPLDAVALAINEARA